MRGNRMLAGLLALLLVVWVVVQLVVSTARRAPASDREASRSAAGPKPEQAIASPPGDAPHTQERVAAASAAQESVPAPSAAPANAQGEGALAIQVEDPEHQPLEGIRLCVVLDDEEGRRDLTFVDLHQGERDTSIVTTFLGRATCFLPAGRPGTLHAWSETASDLEPRALAFEALAPFEERALLVVLRRGRDTALAGQVVDGATGLPVADATVLLREAAVTLDGTSTAEQGEFRIEWQGWRDVHLRIHAVGYSPGLVPLEGDADPEPIRLWRSGSLLLRATLEAGPALDGVSVSLRARLADALPEKQRIGGLLAERIDFTASTDEDGFARLQAVPARVPFELELRGEPFGLARLRVPALQPGEVRSVDWQLDAGLTLTGRLLDQDGLPLVGQEIWLCSADDSSERYFLCNDRTTRLRRATTVAGGSFVLSGIHPGRYRIGPSPSCPRPYPSTNANDVAPWASILEIEEDVPAPEVLLHRPRELYVRGVVVDDRGAPHEAHVTAEHEGGAPGGSLEAGQPFAIGPLIDDVHRVSAAAFDPPLRSRAVNARPLRAREEAEGLQLVLEEDRLGSLSGLVVEPLSNLGLAAMVVASKADSRASDSDPILALAGLAYRDMDASAREALVTFLGSGHSPAQDSGLAMTQTDGTGRFTLEGLDPGPYRIVARTEDSVGLARAVVPGRGDRVRDVLVRVPRPASVVVERTEWHAQGSYSILVDGIAVGTGEWSLGEPFLVPSGALTLMLSDWRRTFFRTLDAPPGGRVAIDLTDDPK